MLVIFLSLDSSNWSILPRLTLLSTSNSLAFVSSSSSLLLFVFLYWRSFCFSLPSYLMSSFSLSIIFSWVAISCWALSISCFKIFSLFSPSASCSQRVVFEVNCCFKLSILKACFSAVSTSLNLLRILFFLIMSWSLRTSCLDSCSFYLRVSNSSTSLGSWAPPV